MQTPRLYRLYRRPAVAHDLVTHAEASEAWLVCCASCAAQIAIHSKTHLPLVDPFPGGATSESRLLPAAAGCMQPVLQLAAARAWETVERVCVRG